MSTSDSQDGPCKVPLVERLASVPPEWREMREVGKCHHRNVPYGAMCHEAAQRIRQLERELNEAKAELANYSQVCAALHKELAELCEDKKRGHKEAIPSGRSIRRLRAEAITKNGYTAWSDGDEFFPDLDMIIPARRGEVLEIYHIADQAKGTQ